LCKKKRKKKSLMCTGGIEEWVLAFIERWRKWGTGEAKVGGKVA
jgi:hypothetical protein